MCIVWYCEVNEVTTWKPSGAFYHYIYDQKLSWYLKYLEIAFHGSMWEETIYWWASYIVQKLCLPFSYHSKQTNTPLKGLLKFVETWCIKIHAQCSWMTFLGTATWNSSKDVMPVLPPEKRMWRAWGFPSNLSRSPMDDLSDWYSKNFACNCPLFSQEMSHEADNFSWSVMVLVMAG